jgi:xylan 1,4-beta-xylosidase
VKVELESVDHQDKLPLRVFLHSIRRTALHAHPELEILLVLKGSVSVRIEGNAYLLGPGDLILVNGNAPHLSQESGDENVLLAVQIDASFTRKYDPDIDRRRFGFNEAFAEAPDAAVFNKFRTICARLLWETRLKNVGYQIAAESLTLELLSLLMREFESRLTEPTLAEEDSVPDASLFYARINRIVALVEKRYREKLSLAEIAKAESLNMTYLSRFFKEKMGYSFTEFVQFIRLKKTLRLLEDTDLKIVDIALDCGFPNVKSYNLVFKRAYRMPPAQWRTERRAKLTPSPSKGNPDGSAYGSHDDIGALSLIQRYLPTL